MTIDNNISEKLVFKTTETRGLEDNLSDDSVLQRYGSLELRRAEAEEAENQPATRSASRSVAPQVKLSRTERLGLKAFQLRNKPTYKKAKSARPGNNELWDMTGCVAPPPEEAATRSLASPIIGDLRPTSAWLEGSVAVGTIIVNGPTPDLRFTAAQEAKVVAEVQAGLSWLADQGRTAKVSFSHDIHVVNISTPKDPDASDLEGHWRNPAMEKMGYEASWQGVKDYVQTLRHRLGTQWAYAAFFVKYPLGNFAYAFIGGPHLVMQYENQWGVNNLDRIFVHETGHIFGCPDEYGTRNCEAEYGRFRERNRNSDNCAGTAKVPCVMDSNNWGMCQYTRTHLGWSGWAAPILCVDSNLAFEIPGASDADGAELILTGWNAFSNQRFLADPLEDGSFRFIAEHSDKVLDVYGESTTQGVHIHQWTWHGRDNQRFWLEQQSDYTYCIRSKKSGLVLTIEPLPPRIVGRYPRIVQLPWNGANNQRFRILSRGISICAQHSDLVLNVNAASFKNGEAVTQSYMLGSGSQRFRLGPLDDGSFRILSEHSGKVLDVYGGSTTQGVHIHQWDWHGGNNQRFLIEHRGDGIFKIVAKHSGLALTVKDASTSIGAEVIQLPWNGSNNQRFRFI